MRNKLTTSVSDCTNTLSMGRPPKARDLRRSERFFLRLTPSEMSELRRASRKSGEPISEILRKGAASYIHSRDKGGSHAKGEKN
jgi:hypothetical protein